MMLAVMTFCYNYTTYFEKWQHIFLYNFKKRVDLREKTELYKGLADTYGISGGGKTAGCTF